MNLDQIKQFNDCRQHRDVTKLGLTSNVAPYTVDPDNVLRTTGAGIQTVTTLVEKDVSLTPLM